MLLLFIQPKGNQRNHNHDKTIPVHDHVCIYVGKILSRKWICTFKQIYRVWLLYYMFKMKHHCPKQSNNCNRRIIPITFSPGEDWTLRMQIQHSTASPQKPACTPRQYKSALYLTLLHNDKKASYLKGSCCFLSNRVPVINKENREILWWSACLKLRLVWLIEISVNWSIKAIKTIIALRYLTIDYQRHISCQLSSHWKSDFFSKFCFKPSNLQP